MVTKVAKKIPQKVKTKTAAALPAELQVKKKVVVVQKADVKVPAATSRQAYQVAINELTTLRGWVAYSISQSDNIEMYPEFEKILSRRKLLFDDIYQLQLYLVEEAKKAGHEVKIPIISADAFYNVMRYELQQVLHVERSTPSLQAINDSHVKDALASFTSPLIDNLKDVFELAKESHDNFHMPTDVRLRLNIKDEKKDDE